MNKLSLLLFLVATVADAQKARHHHAHPQQKEEVLPPLEPKEPRDHATKHEGLVEAKAFEEDEGLVEAKAFEEKALCGAVDLYNARCFMTNFPEIYRKSNAIVKISGNGAVGSGWLAGPNNYVVTNNHVIESQGQADGASFEFGYENPSGNGCRSEGMLDSATPAMVINGGTLVYTNVEMDLSIVKLNSGNPICTFGYLDIENRRPQAGEQIFIAQHPRGRDKSIGYYDSYSSTGSCQIMADANPYDNYIGYTCDTEGGSSGSAVISVDTKKVIGLHKAGSPDCHGNWATPMDLIYNVVAGYIYDGNAMGSCTHPGNKICYDNTDFVVPGYTVNGGPIKCSTRLSNFCGQLGGLADSQGKSANTECCKCGGGSKPCESHSGYKDKWGDSCEWYGLPENSYGCPQYGDETNAEGVSPKQACCECHPQN